MYAALHPNPYTDNPARTAAQVRRILVARLGPAQVPTDRALQRWFAARELGTRPDGRPPEAFGRFQAGAVNEIWTADLMNGRAWWLAASGPARAASTCAPSP